ncbi:hypothetical protein A2W48_02645 [Candidatus Giovannonibacteria bacterium RIFCSPHIGHO2_12_44_12]|uniref:Nucleotidyl transferase AbiEii/AbiGii toxin family protein n=3 Tax=Candidatus Giovannoniibacteriota TaxID=1752738 RepID=A0A1F5X0W5_9BACT|nr:MAG: hypothetical protein A2W57_03675 [Candidatus Giovannonibacteria bacterium RIFCSPHIGHO2_02_43_16]OGF81545.1 MAG: hypothetical protein A2W48_02645 [Candidatus Giovannonibacteria bacterium RIFCSPHIGHO2_12_44_12]OGF85539.1 MAG: hypothetical protein A2Z63_00670 [Candidatus Giovannonibacteria bacterium RIFCSPLOWO2_02_44_8]
MHYDILGEKRVSLLPRFKLFKERFYLAGGTGLALQIGHRDSVDFDFFTADHFDTASFHSELLDIFKGLKIVKTLEEKDSLAVIIDGEVKLSFLRYPYVLLNPAIDEENIKIASIEDIACMKFSAIVSRATWKDYVDLYFIIRQKPLRNLFASLFRKMPDLDQNLVLKSLVYFKDVVDENVAFRGGQDVSRTTVEKFLEKTVKS